jgi:NhaA family Na+:H+ antiporter
MAILLASLTAGTVGFLWLKLLGQPVGTDDDMDAMDFELNEGNNIVDSPTSE